MVHMIKMLTEKGDLTYVKNGRNVMYKHEDVDNYLNRDILFGKLSDTVVANPSIY